MDDESNSREDLEEYAMIVSKKFKSEEEGFEFYNEYAFEKGFGVRKEYVEHDHTTKAIIHRRCRCFKAGYRKEEDMVTTDRQREPRALTRCGCKAEFAISFDKKRCDWFVKKFMDVHNHPLANPGEAGFLWSHRGLSNVQKAEDLELKAGGLRMHQVMEVMEKQYGGFEQVGFTSKDLHNFFDRHKKVLISGGDADNVIRYMEARQQDDMEYFFECEKNVEGCLTRLFWTDPQSRMDYHAFGQVMVFDSTYRVNRYNLPFIPFVSVNHHGSTVIFGCGVLSYETVESYEWLLRTFLKAMCQKHPKSLIIDGDNVMRIAIENVMPMSDHRLCIWHIEQNMIRHLRPDMLPDFRYLVYSPIGPDEFEGKWTEFKEKFNVGEENNWISRMYRLRRKWAAAYTKGRFFLGMKSNQRSESLNSKLHRHLDRKMSLTDLVEHNEHCLSHMCRKEAELDAKDSQSVPFTTGEASLLEKDAANIFTPKAFKMVKSEIDELVKWDIRDIINDNRSVNYILAFIERSEKIVCVNIASDGTSVREITCLCRKLEFEHIPCEHIFVVLHHIGLERIPSCCIKRRWTTKAKYAFPSDRYGEVCSWSDRMDCYHQLHSLGNKALFKACMNEETTLKVMKFLKRILDGDSGFSSDKDATLHGPALARNTQTDQSPEKVLDPMNVVPRGATNKRMRGFLERPQKRVIHCGFCGAAGHTTRTHVLLI